MTTLSVVIIDKLIVKDGAALHFTEATAQTNFDSVVASLGHENVWAVQWDGTSGTIEYSDTGVDQGVPTQSEVDAYIAAYDAEAERLKQLQKTTYLAQDANTMALNERNAKLAETDWWAVSDRTMTAEQTAYRQALRDLPDHATDWNPALSWDDATWTGSLTGVTWPTKPE